MPEQININQADSDNLINEADVQRIELLKMKAEIERLSKMLGEQPQPDGLKDRFKVEPPSNM